MNSRLFFMAVAVIAAFGIAAAIVGPVTIATPALAQNMTGGGNMTMGGNVTGGNMTGGNWTK
jgi:ABC-type enterobactin transport system permease subunit